MKNNKNIHLLIYFCLGFFQNTLNFTQIGPGFYSTALISLPSEGSVKKRYLVRNLIPRDQLNYLEVKGGVELGWRLYHKDRVTSKLIVVKWIRKSLLTRLFKKRAKFILFRPTLVNRSIRKILFFLKAKLAGKKKGKERLTYLENEEKKFLCSKLANYQKALVANNFKPWTKMGLPRRGLWTKKWVFTLLKLVYYFSNIPLLQKKILTRSKFRSRPLLNAARLVRYFTNKKPRAQKRTHFRLKSVRPYKTVKFIQSLRTKRYKTNPRFPKKILLKKRGTLARRRVVRGTRRSWTTTYFKRRELYTYLVNFWRERKLLYQQLSPFWRPIFLQYLKKLPFFIRRCKFKHRAKLRKHRWLVKVAKRRSRWAMRPVLRSHYRLFKNIRGRPRRSTRVLIKKPRSPYYKFTPGELSGDPRETFLEKFKWLTELGIRDLLGSSSLVQAHSEKPVPIAFNLARKIAISSLKKSAFASQESFTQFIKSLTSKLLTQKTFVYLRFKRTPGNYYYTISDNLGRVMLVRNSGQTLKSLRSSRNKKLRRAVFNAKHAVSYLATALKKKNISKIHRLVLQPGSWLPPQALRSINFTFRNRRVKIKRLQTTFTSTHGLAKRSKKQRRL